MSSDRDQLAALLALSRRGVTAKVNDNDRYQADDAIAAGWRPPAQVIETEAEAEALPAGAVVVELHVDLDIDPNPFVWQRVELEGGVLVWQEPGGSRDWPTSHLDLPVRVLHLPIDPTEKAVTE